MKNPCFTAGEDFHGNNTNPSRQDGNSGAVWNDRVNGPAVLFVIEKAADRYKALV